MEWGFYYDVESNRMLEDPYIFTPSRTMTSSRITKESNAGLETYGCRNDDDVRSYTRVMNYLSTIAITIVINSSRSSFVNRPNNILMRVFTDNLLFISNT